MAKFLLTPRDTKFYDLFERDTVNLITATAKLIEFFEDFEEVEARAGELKELEHEGDVITHQIIHRVHSTFVTPIDREDIVLLAHTVDDIIDFVEAAGRTVSLYGLDRPTKRAQQLVVIIDQIAHKLHEVMPCLRHRDQFERILHECVEINSLENEADDVHHAAQAELFAACTNPCDILKWRELYQHLENATDRGEDVADVLEGIVLKNA